MDDFQFIESADGEWKALVQNIKALYSWGKHDYAKFMLCGVQYLQHPDFSITMGQREYAENIAPHDLYADDDLRQMEDNEVISNPRWLKRFRGANGALQWLCTNTRPDLGADTSISSGTSSTGVTKQ